MRRPLKGVNRDEESLFGAGEQPVDDTLIWPIRAPDEPVIATIEAFDLEFLPGFNAILLSELGREHDLTLGGHRRLHHTKIPTYGACVHPASFGS